MAELEMHRRHPQIRQLVVEASHALARLDAARLEELALSCRALNRDLAQAGDADQVPLQLQSFKEQALGAVSDLAVLGRMLEATRANLEVMRRLRDLRGEPIEYSEAQARGWLGTESGHGDD